MNAAYGNGDLIKYKAQEIVARILGDKFELCRDNDYGKGKIDPSLKVTFVAYSGGGQIAYSTAQKLKGVLFVDNLVMFGSPFRAYAGLGNVRRLWNFVSEQDEAYNGNILTEVGRASIPAHIWDLENRYEFNLYSDNATLSTTIRNGHGDN